jgi:23S rRNA pseudouridine2605 synthase
MAACGVGSRRLCETFITAGQVSVNGSTAHLGQSVEPGDKVRFRNKLLELPAQTVIYKMNKPKDYVTTVTDPEGRPTVMDLLPPGLPRVFPIGRLDRDTEGLLLFTNDGELTQKLLHPSKCVFKRYAGLVRALPSESQLNLMSHGLMLDDGPTLPCRCWIEGGRVIIEIQEGRKRQVRRMLGAIGCPVVHLARLSIGPVRLGNIRLGEVVPLSKAEERALRQLVGG